MTRSHAPSHINRMPFAPADTFAALETMSLHNVSAGLVGLG